MAGQPSGRPPASPACSTVLVSMCSVPSHLHISPAAADALPGQAATGRSSAAADSAAAAAVAAGAGAAQQQPQQVARKRVRVKQERSAPAQRSLRRQDEPLTSGGAVTVCLPLRSETSLSIPARLFHALYPRERPLDCHVVTPCGDQVPVRFERTYGRIQEGNGWPAVMAVLGQPRAGCVLALSRASASASLPPAAPLEAPAPSVDLDSSMDLAVRVLSSQQSSARVLAAATVAACPLKGCQLGDASGWPLDGIPPQTLAAAMAAVRRVQAGVPAGGPLPPPSAKRQRLDPAAVAAGGGGTARAGSGSVASTGAEAEAGAEADAGAVDAPGGYTAQQLRAQVLTLRRLINPFPHYPKLLRAGFTGFTGMQVLAPEQRTFRSKAVPLLPSCLFISVMLALSTGFPSMRVQLAESHTCRLPPVKTP